jgi:hypothetical protein
LELLLRLKLPTACTTTGGNSQRPGSTSRGRLHTQRGRRLGNLVGQANLLLGALHRTELFGGLQRLDVLGFV